MMQGSAMKISSLAEDPYWEGIMVELLNKGLERDFISSHTYQRVVRRDPNFDPNLVLLAIEDGELTGVLIGVKRTRAPEEMIEKQKEVAWIKAIAIPPEKRDTSVFKSLCLRFEELTRKSGRTLIRFGDFASWYFFPGVDVLYDYYLDSLIDFGFKKVGDAVNYEIDLRSFYIPPRIVRMERKLKQEGISFRKASVQEKKAITMWVGEKFSPFWAYEVGLGFSKESTSVWLAEYEGRFVGFAGYSLLEPNWFGPIGVDEEMRGKGIGSVLLYKAMNSLRLSGYRIVTVPWTDLLFFYTQLPGIIAIRHFFRVAKELEF